MKQVICDKCHRIIEPYSHHHVEVQNVVIDDLGGAVVDKDYDLCDECLKLFFDWLGVKP